MALARIFLMVGGRAPRVGPGAGVLSEPGQWSLLSQPFVIAYARLLSPAEQKKERWWWWLGGGVIGRDRSAEDPHGPNALQPRERAAPGAHSFARLAGSVLQTPRASGAAAHRLKSAPAGK